MQAGREKPRLKINKYLWFEYRGCICSTSLKAPHLNFSNTFVSNIELQMQTLKICSEGFGSQSANILAISRCRLVEYV